MQETATPPSARIVLADESTWPADLLDYLEANRAVFYGWETQACAGLAPAYDRAVYGLRELLWRHLLHGYHCARLTDAEIGHIEKYGLQLPNDAMLRQRIEV